MSKIPGPRRLRVPRLLIVRTSVVVDLGVVPASGLVPLLNDPDVDPRWPLRLFFCADCGLAQLGPDVYPTPEPLRALSRPPHAGTPRNRRPTWCRWKVSCPGTPSSSWTVITAARGSKGSSTTAWCRAPRTIRPIWWSTCMRWRTKRISVLPWPHTRRGWRPADSWRRVPPSAAVGGAVADRHHSSRPLGLSLTDQRGAAPGRARRRGDPGPGGAGVRRQPAGNGRTGRGPSSDRSERRAVLVAERAAGLDDGRGLAEFRRQGELVAADFRAHLVGQRDAGVSIAGYGAPSKAPVLVALAGIDESILPYTVDLSPEKEGRRLPGTRIPSSCPTS